MSSFHLPLTAPSGWTWVNAPNTITNPTSTIQGGTKYSPEYEKPITVGNTTIYATLKNGSYELKVEWTRLAEE